jgi:hypothetical protein
MAESPMSADDVSAVHVTVIDLSVLADVVGVLAIVGTVRIVAPPELGVESTDQP